MPAPAHKALRIGDQMSAGGAFAAATPPFPMVACAFGPISVQVEMAMTVGADRPLERHIGHETWAEQLGLAPTTFRTLVHRRALLSSLTILALAALAANIDPRVIELPLRAVGLAPLGEGVAALLARLTEGLVVLVLLAAYVEQWPFRKLEYRLTQFRTDVTGRLTELETQMEQQLRQLHLDHLRQHQLRRQLPELLEEQFRAPLGNLLDLLLPDNVNPVLKAQINVRLRSTEDPQWGVYDYTGQYIIRQNEYTIGIVTSKGHVDRLWDANAPIHQMFVLQESGTPNEMSVRQIVEHYKIRLRYLDQRTSLWLDAPAQPIEQPNLIWDPTNPQDQFALTLLRFAMPDDPSGRGRLVRLTYELPLSLEDGFCFWAATRPTYVEQIILNAADLRGVCDVKFERFLPNFDRTNTFDQVTDRVYTLVVENWLLKGHGVILCWQREGLSHRSEPSSV